VGYYTRHYRHGYPGFRSGVYGWAGGDAGFYADWVFCDRSSFGRRRHSGHRGGHDYYRGHDWNRRHGGHAVPRGILTTDTRPLRPSLWNDPEGSIRVLRTRPGVAGRRDVAVELPDVTPFVSRRGGELPGDVAKRVAITRGEVDRVAGTPLAPGTSAPEVRLARPRTGVRAGGADGVDVTPRKTVTTNEPGVRSARPATGIRGEATPAAGGERTDRGDAPPRARAGRPVAVERADAPRADAPRAKTPPAAERPSADRPAAGRPGVTVRRSPGADASAGDGDRGGSLSGGRAVRPRSSGDPEASPRGSERNPEPGLSGWSPRAARPPAVRQQTPERNPERGLSSVSPRAERPTTVRPRTIEPRGGDPRGSAASGSTPSGSTVRRSAPRAARPEARSERPEAPVNRAPSAGVRAPAQRSAPVVRSQSAPSRPPAARSAPVVRSQPRSGAPAARSAPSRAPVVRSQPSGTPAPRSKPAAGSSGRGGGGGSAKAGSGGGATRSRGGSRDRG
jgi:hypothetical protein